MNNNFTFLAEGEALNFNALSIFGLNVCKQCEVTDYAIFTGCSMYDNGSWTTRTGKYRDFINNSIFNAADEGGGIEYDGYLLTEYNRRGREEVFVKINVLCNARPGLSYLTIKKEDIIAEKKLGNFIMIEYGEYPQMVEGIEISKKLERNINRLKSTRKKYHSNKHKIREYEYMGRKYIRIIAPDISDGEILSNGRKVIAGNAYWIRVEPIKWFVDIENDIALSEKVLFAINFRPNSYRYRNPKCFTESYPYYYLNNIFAKDIVPHKKYLDNYKRQHDDINMVIYSQLTKQQINSSFQNLDIFTPKVNITLIEYNEELISNIRKLCPNYINLNISVRDRKKANDIHPNDKNDLYINELKKLINALQSQIDNLSDDIKKDVYEKFSFIIEEYNNKLEKIKNSVLNIDDEKILTLDSDDPKYLNQDLFIKLTSFLRTLNSKPHLLELLDSINNILNYIDNNTPIKYVNEVTNNIVNIINISNLINTEDSNIIINNIKDILINYKNKISNELNSLTKKEIKLILKEENYEEGILNDINSIWSSIRERNSLVLIYQILNCKSLLLNNTLNIISLNNDKGTFIQNKIIEISNLLNNYSNNIKQEIINRINDYLNRYLTEINKYNTDEIIEKLNKFLSGLDYNLKYQTNKINSTYSTPKIRIRNKK